MEYKDYLKKLFEIRRDYDVEQYYDELIRPFLKECISKETDIKIIPTFDTRYHCKDRSRFKGITGDERNFVWPDYVFVPLEYTHNNPINPYVKVEFKRPNIEMPNIDNLKGKGMVYYPIFNRSNILYEQIKGELSTCPLILTDGITWVLLNKIEDLSDLKAQVDESENTFIEKKGKHNSGNIVDFPDENDKFKKVKENIADFIVNSKMQAEENKIK